MVPNWFFILIGLLLCLYIFYHLPRKLGKFIEDWQYLKGVLKS
jgi:hypothetical protein